ncbi:MAG: 50S ribosomal protein L11 methyltransferase [Deferribacteraceae bacterium]|jgi:ribosomal protein L11 methyltransferase|nr:50S ribosomal protein L11 methyltransferase [Deferribacteraceae bacterium]
MSDALKRQLELLSVQIAEEKFGRKASWLLYSESSLDDLLASRDIVFEKKTVDDSGWENLWQNYIEEGWLTEKVYYCFKEKTFDDGRIAVFINPSLAFGTGNHPTTRLAARLLEKVAKAAVMLEIGTGSAILAIMASKLGYKAVYACDNDIRALKNAKENINSNCCDNIFLWAGSIRAVKPTFKPYLVAANIISTALKEIHPYILRLHPKYIVYSGILKKEGSSFISSLDMHGYQPEEVLHSKEWSGIRLKAET